MRVWSVFLILSKLYKESNFRLLDIKYSNSLNDYIDFYINNGFFGGVNRKSLIY